MNTHFLFKQPKRLKSRERDVSAPTNGLNNLPVPQAMEAIHGPHWEGKGCEGQVETVSSSFVGSGMEG